jgi:two-component system, OmpR family, sensor kinase
MRSVRWNSVRVRLTLWNAGLLALLLAGSGIHFCYHARADLMRSVDRDLAQRADEAVRHWSFRLSEGSHPGFGDEARYPPDGVRPRFAGQAGSAEERVRRRGDYATKQVQPSRPVSSDAGRRRDWKRPRVLTLAGKSGGLNEFVENGPWDWTTFALSAAGASRYSIVRVEGESFRVFSRPLIRNGTVENVIQLAHPLGELDRLHHEHLHGLLALIPLALLVAGLLGIFMTDRTLRPVRQITQAAAQIGAADLSRRLKVAGEDEFAELAETFNGMISRLEQAFTHLEGAYRRLEQAYEQQRRFTADASHELRTPLSRIKGSASLALSAPRTPGEYCKALRVVDQAADVMSRLIQDLLLLARADAGALQLDPQRVAVAALFHRVLAAVPEGRTASLHFDGPDRPLAVQGHLELLVRLFVNLIENAIRHTPEEGQITLSAREEGAEVVITVADTGTGIPPDHLPHVCERFYRVDAARTRAEGGAGLGLAICRSIAEAHGGRLEIQSDGGRGTTVRVMLPATRRTRRGVRAGRRSGLRGCPAPGPGSEAAIPSTASP